MTEQEYEFELHLPDKSDFDEKDINQLFEAGADDAMLSLQDGHVHDAPSHCLRP